MSIVKIIGESELFQALSKSQLAKVGGMAQSKILPQDVTIFNEGDELAHLYLVRGGSIRLSMGVQLWSGNAAPHSIVSIIGPGGTFGWSSLIKPYEAVVSDNNA